MIWKRTASGLLQQAASALCINDRKTIQLQATLQIKRRKLDTPIGAKRLSSYSTASSAFPEQCNFETALRTDATGSDVDPYGYWIGRAAGSSGTTSHPERRRL